MPLLTAKAGGVGDGGDYVCATGRVGADSAPAAAAAAAAVRATVRARAAATAGPAAAVVGGGGGGGDAPASAGADADAAAVCTRDVGAVAVCMDVCMYACIWCAYMYAYDVCQIFLLLPTFLFVRALFGQTPSTRTHEARSDTLVEVSARSVHSGARGGHSFFFPAGVDKTISLVSVCEALFCSYISVNVACFFR